MAKKNAPPPAAGVKLEAIYLQRIQMERIGPWPEDHDELELGIKWGIGAVRLRNGRLGVEIAVQINQDEMISLEVAYRMELAATGDIPHRPGPDAFWRDAAAKVAPIIAVPYIREIVQSLSGRALNESVLLPIANYGAYFKPEEIVLGDEAKGDEPEAAVLQLKRGEPAASTA
jgi:preprotein translocase subunit SecB